MLVFSPSQISGLGGRYRYSPLLVLTTPRPTALPVARHARKTAMATPAPATLDSPEAPPPTKLPCAPMLTSVGSKQTTATQTRSARTLQEPSIVLAWMAMRAMALRAIPFPTRPVQPLSARFLPECS
jgi:hypothetical protein